jgi:hypothetical protein
MPELQLRKTVERRLQAYYFLSNVATQQSKEGFINLRKENKSLAA